MKKDVDSRPSCFRHVYGSGFAQDMSKDSGNEQGCTRRPP